MRVYELIAELEKLSPNDVIEVTDSSHDPGEKPAYRLVLTETRVGSRTYHLCTKDDYEAYYSDGE